MTNWFKKDLTAAEKFARLVVLKRLAIVAAVTTVLSVLVSFHLVTADLSNYAVSWVNRAIEILAFLVAIPYVQSATTPADPALQPVSKNGLPLVEQGVESASNAKPNAYVADVDDANSLDERPDSDLSKTL